MNISNILANAPLEQKLQILINNEMSVILNAEATIKPTHDALLFNSMESKRMGTKGSIREIDHYFSHCPSIKGVTAAILQIERAMHAIESTISFNHRYEAKIRFTKSLIELGDELDNMKMNEDESFMEAMRKFLFQNHNFLTNSDEEKRLYELGQSKIKKLMKSIQSILKYIEKTKAQFDFKVPAIDKKIADIQCSYQEYCDYFEMKKDSIN